MNVSLTAELEQLVTEKVKTGMYQTDSEVVREGLRLLKARDDRMAQLRGDIRVGFEAINRAEYEDYDKHTTKSLAKDIKKRGRQRFAEASKKTGMG